ncbi:MAG: SPASM domain-containing protein, partial [Sphaerochaetaceae bacterium]|nr:SPASM domain-containing protein [Sphaerochaetaceae bacterium]
GSYFVCEGDGSLYPCDFYVLDQWKIGNVADNISLNAITKSKLFLKFQEEGKLLGEKCKNCPYLVLCNGGCRRDRDYWTSLGENYFCQCFKNFFEYALPRLEVVVKAEIQARRENTL